MVVDWVAELFDSTGFQVRGHCGPWSEPLKLLSVASHAIIALAFFLISYCLHGSWKEWRQDLAHRTILTCFAAVIMLGGLTHVCDVVVWCWPGYHLFILISALTAAVSIASAMYLPSAIRCFLNVPIPAHFQRELNEAVKLKDEAIETLNGELTMLHQQVNHLEQMRKTGRWVAEQESILDELKLLLNPPTEKVRQLNEPLVCSGTNHERR
jgi:hypothetical protein